MSRLIRLDLKEIQKPISKFLKIHDISIVTGMAGTGKDFICMHTALSYLTEKNGKYDKIIISKPIVETGRSMGALPGDVSEKIDPYRSSFDAIVNEILPRGENKAAMTLKKKIEFEPVNFVRGNTFKNAIVILSEAQNCTLHELVSFATRLDKSSKMFLNGDIDQSDIGNVSGLNNFMNITDNIHGIGRVELGDEHQTRNKLIVKITKNYSSFLKNKFNK
mgnify:FL=1|tara:strand:+ start:343 stop:1002 length:660 start_codon:yes stop_codon:yes gene_type:complete